MGLPLTNYSEEEYAKHSHEGTIYSEFAPVVLHFENPYYRNDSVFSIVSRRHQDKNMLNILVSLSNNDVIWEGNVYGIHLPWSRIKLNLSRHD